VVEQVIKAEQVPVEPEDDADLDPSGESWDTWSESLDRYSVEADAEPVEDGHPACHTCGSSLFLRLDGWVCFDCEHRVEQALTAPAEGSMAFDRPELFVPPCPNTEWVSTSATNGVLRRVEPGPRPSRLERYNPTPVERAEAAAIFRDNGTGGYVVVRRKPVHTMVGHPPIDVQDVPHSELCEAGAYYSPRFAY
jgi:hypothetical protein